MKLRSRFLNITSVALFVLAGGVAYGGASEKPENDLLLKLRELERVSENERVLLLNDLGQELHRLEESLGYQLDNGDQDVKCYAAFLLGRFHFEKQVNTLARWILLEDKVRPFKAASREWYWGPYPAASALVSIGKPSVGAMIENIQNSPDEKVRVFSLFVIRAIEGKEIAEMILRTALKGQVDARKKERLTAALTLLATGPARPW